MESKSNNFHSQMHKSNNILPSTRSLFRLPPPSEEQINVVVNSDNNIIVNSVAGSGKTTTILHLAQTMNTAAPYEQILLLTYNKKLKLETRRKIELLGLNNIEAHSYHSCAVKYYDYNCHDDYRMIKVVDEMEAKNIPAYTRIIIDEAQDMTELYYKFVCVLIRDIVKTFPSILIKFAIIGDRFQSIFNFNGADYRFIQYADVLFGPFSKINYWKECKLSTSYRITNPMANFLNKVILKTDRLIAIKKGPPIDYIICNTFGYYPSQLIYDSITQKVYDSVTGSKLLYKFEDIFILAPSVKSPKSPVRKVANFLSSHKLPVFVPGSDEEPLDEDVLKGKIVFSTLHQVKGLERKCIFLFGFDQSYYNYFAKNASKDICPNTLYVALTRSLEKLYIFHHNQHDYLSFMNTDILHNYVNVQIKDKMKIATSRSINSNVCVTELTRHISAKVIFDAMEFFSYTDLNTDHSILLDIPTRIDSCFTSDENKKGDNHLTETVAELNGVALALYFEYETTGSLEILDELIKNTDVYKIPGIKFNSINDYTFTMNPENLLKLANTYCSYRSKYIFKMNQIGKYDWLNENHLNASYQIMKDHISDNCKFEVYVSSKEPIRGKNITGRIDILDLKNKTIWEIKAITVLKFEHIIQTALYGYLFNDMISTPAERIKLLGSSNEVEFKYKLFNILDGHIIEIKFDPFCLENMLAMLIHAKYFDNRTIEDDKFIIDLLAVNSEYIKPLREKNRNIHINQPTTALKTIVSASSIQCLESDSLF